MRLRDTDFRIFPAQQVGYHCSLRRNVLSSVTCNFAA